jgi:hypothetical protein
MLLTSASMARLRFATVTSTASSMKIRSIILYTGAILCEFLALKIADQKIQFILLSDPNQSMSLKEAKEAEERLALCLHDTLTVESTNINS